MSWVVDYIRSVLLSKLIKLSALNSVHFVVYKLFLNFKK